MPYYKVKKTSLITLADAIRSTAGTDEDLTFPEGFVEAVEGIEAGGGETLVNKISDVLSLVPAFDDTWTTTKFTLASAPPQPGFDIPNPIGRIPEQIFVLKLDIDYTIGDHVIGGYNIGNITADHNDNRTIRIDSSGGNGTIPDTNNLIRRIVATNWNFQSDGYGASTEDAIKVRVGTSGTNNVWLAGEYILAVK